MSVGIVVINFVEGHCSTLGKRTNSGTSADSGTIRVLKRDANMILYGSPATSTVSLSVPLLVRSPYTGIRTYTITYRSTRRVVVT